MSRRTLRHLPTELRHETAENMLVALEDGTIDGDPADAHRIFVDLLDELGPVQLKTSARKYGSAFPSWFTDYFKSPSYQSDGSARGNLLQKRCLMGLSGSERRWVRSAVRCIGALVQAQLRPDMYTVSDAMEMRDFVLEALPVCGTCKLLNRECVVFESGKMRDRVEFMLRRLAENTNSIHAICNESSTVFRTRNGGYRGLLFPKLGKHEKSEVREKTTYPLLPTTPVLVFETCPDCDGLGTKFDGRFGGNRTCERCVGKGTVTRSSTTPG